MHILYILSFIHAVRAAGPSAVPPNVIVVLVDDFGFGDVDYNCHDNSTGMCAETPNLSKLASSQHSAVLHRFYATAGICSPTRAALLTGRNNQRDCIQGGLGCDAETPAPYCAQGKKGALPTSEFSIADAAKKTALGDYSTLFLGKWHLGDLWDKGLPGMNENWPVSAPWGIGFDHWLATQAEASSSTPNCGCFQVTHEPGEVGPRPPENDIAPTIPRGEACYAGGGYAGDWCFLCTNYYYSNASSSDPKNVSDLKHKVAQDDSNFLLDVFEEYVQHHILPDTKTKGQPRTHNEAIMFTDAYNTLHPKAKTRSGGDKTTPRPFLAHLCLHSIHEPHPALPEYYNRYTADPDYLGVVAQLDTAIGRLMNMLESYDLLDNTMVIFTSDNGPHMGNERTDVTYSTGNMRQCKKSIFEGGLRVPGIIHAPFLINENKNVTVPFGSVDILPTIMDVLQVSSDNPTWTMDGISMIPFISNVVTTGHQAKRPSDTPLTFWYLNTSAIIDNNWKLVYSPELGVRNCPIQPPYDEMDVEGRYFLFNLDTDSHELYDLKEVETAVFHRLRNEMNEFKISVNYSQHFETGCTLSAVP